MSEKNTDLLVSNFDQILERVELLTGQMVANALRFYYKSEGELAVNFLCILDVR